MTATAMARCACCETDRPAAEVFGPYPGAVRCKNVRACERRRLRAYDPTIPPDEDMPAPPAASAPPGARCAVCEAPGGLYERGGGQWVCRDQAGCQARAVEVQFLHAWGDSSPDRLIDAAQMRAAQAAAGAEIPPERAEPGPAELAALAAADALGRKRQ